MIGSQELEATRRAAAAALAGGIISASGRPYSMDEAMGVFHDAYFSLFPDETNGLYAIWRNQHNPKRRHGPDDEMSP
jgi:hypothetical protein